MSRNITFILLLAFTLPSTLLAQPVIGIPGTKQQKTDGEPPKRPIWQCGRTRGVVDCNGDLMIEPARNLVVDRNTGEPYTGTCESCHRNGTRQRVVNFKNGKDDGIDTTWYDNGAIQVVRSHIEGYADGTWQYFYESHPDTPRMAWEIQYSVNQKTGKHQYFYDKEGSPLKKEETYANDLLNGPRIEYYDDGVTKRKEVHYKDGIQHGPHITYYENAQVETEANYEEGKVVGEVKVYYKDGSLYSIENYDKNSQRDGAFITYTPKGDTVELKTYKGGLKHGKFLLKRENGKMAWEAEYELCKKCVTDSVRTPKKDTVVYKQVKLDGSRMLYEYRYDEFGERIEVIDEEDDEVPEKENDRSDAAEVGTEKKPKKKKGKKDK